MFRVKVRPLWQMTQDLVSVARGDREPEGVLTGARVLCVYTGKIREDQEIWIWGGRIARICEAGTFAQGGPGRASSSAQVFDCQGALLAPGLVDPHVHVESSRVSVCHYAEAALRGGTTAIIADNHEMANVCDLQGLEWMVEDGRRAPLNVFWTVPSTVPATSPQLETAGGDLTPEKIGTLMDKYPDVVIALGEKMDYPQVVAGEVRPHAVIAEALKRGLPVSGHVYGAPNVAPYAAAGVTDTHEAIDRGVVQACLRAGMWVLLRGGPPGTAWDSLPEAVKAVTESGCDTARVCLCTDDRSPAELLEYGLDHVVREAMAAGIDPVTAWRMASLNPATRYGLDGEIGGLGHGRRADVVLVDDRWVPRHVWFGGTQVIADRRPTAALRGALKSAYAYPEAALHTVKLPKAWRAFPEPLEADSVAHVIGIRPPGILTDHLTLEVPGGTPLEAFLREHDLAVMAVLERHGKGRSRAQAQAHGLLKGLGIQDAAVASTVGHDAHNLLVVGDNEADMVRAVRTLEERQGGLCVVSRGEVLALVPLPIAGLMSPEPVEAVAAQSEALREAMRSVGCRIGDMEITLLTLSVIPELRLTDVGLVKVPQMEVIPLFEAKSGG